MHGIAGAGPQPKLCSAVLAAFIGALRRSLRRRAKRTCALDSVEDAQFGAVTFIQRADSSLRLNVHYHCLVLDGVYVHDGEGQLHFHALPRPTPEQVAELADEQPALAACYGASVGDRELLGASPGEQTRKLVHPVRELDSPDEALADFGGVNIHVGPVIDGRDRKRLERLCRSWSASRLPGATVRTLSCSTRST